MNAPRSGCPISLTLEALGDRWIGLPIAPVLFVGWAAPGRHDHRAEGIQMFKTFPDNRVHNRPYRVFFAQRRLDLLGCEVHRNDEGADERTDGKDIPPTGKSFEVDFCTVARWENSA